ncbi:MAG TPA: hypothetical protein VFC26_03335 [Verrucomicrobiae bacterium]|nr:hypothetical protein [Verrucomicrobiae bacterium]
MNARDLAASVELFAPDDLELVEASARQDRARLDAERLSAEFRSPLHRNNLRRALKRAAAAEKRETAIETRDAGKRRPIVLTIYPGYLEIGLKGTRRRFTVAYDAVYALGARISAAQARLEKLEAKKARAKR